MKADATDGKATFSELQLGIRELFRILVPGAYLVGLLQFLAPQSSLVTKMSASTLSQVAAMFFLGVFGYALRVHEKWWPYFRTFERQRKLLNQQIVKVIGGESTIDQVNLYKYFLETEATDLKDRIHYFSSFYYMLTELSLFSIGSALGLAFSALSGCYLLQFRSVQAAPPGTFTASLLVIAAAAVQVFLLFGLAGIRNPGTPNEGIRERLPVLLAHLPPLLIAIAIAVLMFSLWTHGLKGSVLDVLGDYRVWAFAILGFVFYRLAAKQWSAIIGEQVVLVTHRADALVQIYKFDPNAPRRTS